MIGDGSKALAKGKAVGASEIARLALGGDEWRLGTALSRMPEGGEVHIPEAIDAYSDRLRPLKELEPENDGPMSQAVLEAFAPIGAKMRPDMSQDQALHWGTAIVLAFSDLPPFVVVKAMKEAIHVPFRFPNDVEAGIRDIASKEMIKHRQAQRRLQLMMEELERARSGQLLIEDEAAKTVTMAKDDIRPLSPYLRKMGVTVGAIDPDILASLEAEEEADAKDGGRGAS